MLGHLFRRHTEERAALPPWTVTVGPPAGPLPTWAGQTVGPDQAMRLASVWSCVKLLSDTVSTLPVDVFRRGEREPLEPTPLILQEPASSSPLHDWLYSVMVSLLLRGNAYAVTTARSGATLLPSQCELVHPDAVGVQTREDGSVLYRILGKEVDSFDVLHIRAFTMPGSVCGLSPTEYARQSIGAGLAMERFSSAFFGDSATPSGLLTTTDKLGPDQVENLNEQWKATQGGKRKTAILTGNLKWEPITIAPEESQFVESSKLNVAQVARIFGVPPEMIGGESGQSLTYANIESRGSALPQVLAQPVARPTRRSARPPPAPQPVRAVQHRRPPQSRHEDEVRGPRDRVARRLPHRRRSQGIGRPATPPR